METPQPDLSSEANPDFVCDICAEPKSSNDSFPIDSCEHAYCKDCMSKYVSSQLQKNISSISCPVSDCEGRLEPESCGDNLPKEVLEKWGDVLCEASIRGLEKLYCPYKDCSAMMIVDEDNMSVEEAECLSCRRLFCAKCEVPWHAEISCDEFEKLHEEERESEDIRLKKLAEEKQWKRCPSCRFYVERTEGCRYMACRCGASFCYGCGDGGISRETHYCCVCKA